MRAAALDEIFSDDTSIAHAEDDIFSAAAAPVRKQDSMENEAEEQALSNFEQEKQPQLKTRQEVIAEGIDRTPMLSVAQIKERFSKGKAPVFPKLPAGASRRSPQKTSGRGEIDTSSLPKVGAALKASTATAAPALSPAAAQASLAPSEPGPSVDEEAAAKPSDELGLKDINVESLSQEEFMRIAALHGCADAITFYTTTHSVEIVIKPETPTGDSILVKNMELRYNPEQRLLVMVRKSATRYIRLNDVNKIDATANALAFVAPAKLPLYLADRVPVALYFSTTKYPMVIMVGNEGERDQLMRLVVFLRQLLKTETPLEVCV